MYGFQRWFRCFVTEGCEITICLDWCEIFCLNDCSLANPSSSLVLQAAYMETAYISFLQLNIILFSVNTTIEHNLESPLSEWSLLFPRRGFLNPRLNWSIVPDWLERELNPLQNCPNTTNPLLSFYRDGYKIDIANNNNTEANLCYWILYQAIFANLTIWLVFFSCYLIPFCIAMSNDLCPLPLKLVSTLNKHHSVGCRIWHCKSQSDLPQLCSAGTLVFSFTNKWSCC